MRLSNATFDVAAIPLLLSYSMNRSWKASLMAAVVIALGSAVLARPALAEDDGPTCDVAGPGCTLCSSTPSTGPNGEQIITCVYACGGAKCPAENPGG